MPSSAYVRTLPKVQLHCHLEGSVAPQTFRKLAARHGVDIGVRGVGPPEDAYAFSTFGEFLLLFAEVCKTLRTPEDFADVARDYAADAIAHNVLYAEIFISPSVWTYFHRDIDVRGVVAGMRRVFDEARRDHGLRVAFIADLTRNFGPEHAVASAYQAAKLRDLGVVGIGLGGDEAKYPARLFAEAFDVARIEGLHVVAHAGEAAGPESVREALDILGAERIGHGVRSLEDDALVDDLAWREAVLEICPTSNALTGAVPAGTTHPIVEFHRRGVCCVIDADDPALFGTTISDEYAKVAAMMGEGALPHFVRNAIDASFAADSVKTGLHDRLNEFCAETIEGRRNP